MKHIFTFLVVVVCSFFSLTANASRIFIPMDSTGQNDHLKAYGIAFAAMKEGISVDWLLNYKGGSFAIEYSKEMRDLCMERGVTYAKMTEKDYAKVVARVTSKDFNGDIVHLQKLPKIAVYTPSNKEPWDDAVTLALTYAGIPFDKVYADEVLSGKLAGYDWLHIHHEDFTGQYCKFWQGFHNTVWYTEDQKREEEIAHRNGFKKVSQMELAVVKKIRDFVSAGGNMFAMCAATETFDIALAADGTDICDTMYDGDKADSNAQEKLDFSKCFAFRNFIITTKPYDLSFSDIDNTNYRRIQKNNDYFTLNHFNAKINPVPALLCQDHSHIIMGFMGKTTAFRNRVLKPEVMVMADFPQQQEAKYIHGEYGNGTWTFYGGHDPEDYQHNVGNPSTDLSLHKNSAGYRLILNNVLFPGTKSKTTPSVVMNNTMSATPEYVANDSELVLSRILLYPNPSTNELIISLPTGTSFNENRAGSNNAIQKVQVFNNAGQVVSENSFNADKVSIYLNDLPTGVYYIKVNGVYAGRVVKE